jgi:hypothetical protein
MRGGIVPVLLIAAGVVGIAQHDAIDQQWAAIFPDNPARQTALTRCFEEDHLFNRFSAAARGACYQKWLLAADLPGGSSPAVSLLTPNPVDQARAVGESLGGLPKNDIRNEAAVARYRQARQSGQ